MPGFLSSEPGEKVAESKREEAGRSGMKREEAATLYAAACRGGAVAQEGRTAGSEMPPLIIH